MADIKLFRIEDGRALELPAHYALVEKDLHLLIEKNLEEFFGIRLLAHERGTGKNQRGHIDTLGLDENNCPVIIEYKRRNNENIICQGLYYLDWLLDHQGDFLKLVGDKFGHEQCTRVEFAGTRVLCVAADFSRFDECAARQIGRNVELVRYRFFGQDLIMLELLNSSVAPFLDDAENDQDNNDFVGMPISMRNRLRGMSDETELLYLELLAFAETLGEDVSIKFLKHYIALSRLKNFTSAQPLKNSLKLWLNLDPDEIAPEEGFSRDVREVGHHASGNLEVEIHSMADLERAKPLIELAYRKN